jgi:oligosaccharide 4-alpha-D-glucosyltransferase
MLGMSMSGVPYIHADAGGFALGDGDPELYTRWLQFASFTPVLRPHGTALGDLAPEVKDIPSEGALYDDPYKSIVRKYIRLRYKLLPYNYTLAYEQARYGTSLVRPMFYDQSIDSNLYNATEQFMWGSQILVAPVLEKNAVTKNIYLPTGIWYNLITDEKNNGARWQNEKVILDDIPIFVKEGSFIPMFISGNVKNTSEYDGKKLTVKYYPSSIKSEYTLFDDDGQTNNTLKNGKYELIRFEGFKNSDHITIVVKPGNKKNIKSRTLFFEIAGSKAIRSVNINGKNTKVSKEISVEYKGDPVQLDIFTTE